MRRERGQRCLACFLEPPVRSLNRLGQDARPDGHRGERRPEPRQNSLYVPGLLTEVAELRLRLVGRFDAWRDWIVRGRNDSFAAFRSVRFEDGHVVLEPRAETYAGLYARPAQTVAIRPEGCEASSLALKFEETGEPEREAA